MSYSYRPLRPARPALDSYGIPYSDEYGDVYHAAQGALEQARHVFIAGNGLPDRWAGRQRFVVCETGFGLGSNFLALWQAWRDDPGRCQRLHVLSFEAHPFLKDDLQAMWRASLPTELQSLAAQLAAQWPEPLPGLHRLEFEAGAVTLTLGFGEAQALAASVDARVDAYFLDGFSPAKNPDMWSPHLFRRLARMAAPDATLATWCSAGHVRRALADAGFLVERRPGLCGKLHISVGWRRELRTPRDLVRHPHAGERSALVVGAGPAGAGIAHSLALRGWDVQVLDPTDALAGGAHQGHVAAACVPLVARDDNARARLARAGNLRAVARWADLGDGTPLRCGALSLEKPGGRASDLRDALTDLAFPQTWVRWMEADEASARAGVALQRGGAYFSSGMMVRPPSLLHALLSAPGVTHRRTAVTALQRGGSGWQALDENGVVLAEAAVVVVANAAGAWPLLHASGLQAGQAPRLAAMHALGGAITQWPQAVLAGGPTCVVGGEGYLLPALAGYCVVGSTYEPNAASIATVAQSRVVIANKMAQMLAGFQPSEHGQQETGDWRGWRAVVPGRLPVLGSVPGMEDLWVAAAFGSRGFSWAALAGDVIAATLEGEPLPLERELLQAVSP